MFKWGRAGEVGPPPLQAVPCFLHQLMGDNVTDCNNAETGDTVWEGGGSLTHAVSGQ